MKWIQQGLSKYYHLHFAIPILWGASELKDPSGSQAHSLTHSLLPTPTQYIHLGPTPPNDKCNGYSCYKLKISK